MIRKYIALSGRIVGSFSDIGTMREWSRNARGYTAKTEEGGERRMGSNAEEGAALRGIAAHTPLPSFRGFGRITPSFEAPFAALSLLYPRRISTLSAR